MCSNHEQVHTVINQIQFVWRIYYERKGALSTFYKCTEYLQHVFKYSYFLLLQEQLTTLQKEVNK